MEDFVLAVDDVNLEEKFVKEVVDVAPQHLAGTPITLIEKLVDTCKRHPKLLMKCRQQSA